MKSRSAAQPVLVIQHCDYGHAAVIGRTLECQGIPIQVCNPHRGERYPDIHELSGIVSMGGPMMVGDHGEHPWIPDELRLLKEGVDRNLPVVGVCLGGQLLARALGAEVYTNPSPEIGWFPITLSAEGRSDPVLGAAGPEPTVYQWHNETFELPAEAALLAGSQACPRQAFRVGDRIYGFQFHPEADRQMVDEWFHYEGNEEELEEYLSRYGKRFVQDAGFQLTRSAQGERASLSITAALGQLFRGEAYEPISEDLYEQLETWAMHRTELLLEVTGSRVQELLIRGDIVKLLNLPAGDFLIFRQRNRLLWAIRLDDILRIIPV